MSGPPVTCPACGSTVESSALEKHGIYSLFACASCGLQFWNPRDLPAAEWYEILYGGRDSRVLPLEPGHRYFLGDPAIPKQGELLDVGCGTGNFLAAARAAGFQVTGTELDGKAADFARDKLGLCRIFPLNVRQFADQYPTNKYDVVTFFEVLEHQSDPAGFLSDVRSCLRPGGFIALSVPNRARWRTGPDVVDYPPNHFLRWNVASLRSFLERWGFAVISIREEAINLEYAAAMVNMALRTGLTKKIVGGEAVSFRDLMLMKSEQAAQVLRAVPSVRERLMQALGRVKRKVCRPLAVALWPYLRLQGYKGAYLYCLAKRKEEFSNSPF